jgi:hypothetical protein
MAKHAAVSSNLAALSLHVTRMLRELVRDIQKSSKTNGNHSLDFSRRISRVAKARATAGALQLLRLLCHSVVVKCSRYDSISCTLEEALMYKTRGDVPCDQPAARPLLHSILDLIAVVRGSDHTHNEAIQTPEVYDVLVLTFQLLFVLCGTQLYQPFESSFQQRQEGKSHMQDILEEIFREGSEEPVDKRNLRLFYASSRSSFSQTSLRDTVHVPQHTWTPRSILETCMEWQIRRPVAPERSIAHYYNILALSAVSAKGGETVGSDGMYESHLVVQATSEKKAQHSEGSNGSIHTTSHEVMPHRRNGNIILDATKGVLNLSGSILLLPFRLMSLVFGVLASKKGQYGDHRALSAIQRFKSQASSRTRDVLWLSDSILADLGSCLVLLLVNNNRNRNNPFRTQLKALEDNRWENDNTSLAALPDLPEPLNGNDNSSHSSFSVGDLIEDDEQTSLLAASSKLLAGGGPLTVNFENLFEAFGRTLHTEVGALMLYTLLQSSPSFAESLAVRSDLDTLVLPLLRTLYFASRTNTYMAKDFASSASTQVLDTRSCPFRSLSQLYVIIILLLLFSQDSSFGRDAFRRITVTNVLWYKERHLRNINLGSVLLLTLLRSLLFNLQRLQDAFLLSNCCAVLMNLSPSVVDLHEYAAMRLASVTVSVMKRHVKLHVSSASLKTEGDKSGEDTEADLSTPLGMYAEVARTLLGIIKHCLSHRNIERNLHLVYALVYHQVDMLRLFKNEKNPYSSKETDRIQSIIQTAASMIQEEGARTAPKALKVLEGKIGRLQKAAAAEKKRKHQVDDFNFTYEEEADPEVFFVPYVWETIVCVVTSSTVEWRKDDIRVFSLLEPIEVEPMIAESAEVQVGTTGQFGKYAEDLV